MRRENSCVKELSGSLNPPPWHGWGSHQADVFVSTRYRASQLVSTPRSKQTVPGYGDRALGCLLFDRNSPHQTELACLHTGSRLQSVEIHSRWQTGCVERDLMVACFLFSILENCDLLTQRIVDRQVNV
jgi:hypothetical protein